MTRLSDFVYLTFGDKNHEIWLLYLQEPRTVEYVADLSDVEISVEIDMLLDDLQGLILDLDQLHEVRRSNEVDDVRMRYLDVTRVNVLDQPSDHFLYKFHQIYL